jgi:hypothetical protein
VVSRSLLVTVVAVGACCFALPALAKTPYPPRAAGSGSEATAGSGIGAGAVFGPRFALVSYDGSNYVLYLTRERVACNDTLLAKPPYLTVTIVGGSPLAVGTPTPNSGEQSFVQVDFFVKRPSTTTRCSRR